MARSGFSASQFHRATGRSPGNVTRQLPKAFAWLVCTIETDGVSMAVRQIVSAHAGMHSHPHARTCAMCFADDGIKSLIEMAEAMPIVERHPTSLGAA